MRLHLARSSARGTLNDDEDNYDDFGDDDFYDIDDTFLLHPGSRMPADAAHDEDDSSLGGSQLQRQQQSSVTEKKSHFFSQKPLEDPSFHIDGERRVFELLCHRAGITRPSKIQSMAWPILVLQEKHQQKHNAIVIAEQTGSGKTLAYLIPILQRVIHMRGKATTTTTWKQQQQQSLREPSTAAVPQALILAPTAELADQIYAVCRKLSESSDADNTKPLFSTVVLTASGKQMTNIRDQIRMLQQKKSMDVLISTPGRIATILRTKHAQERVLDLRQLQIIVLDEVDILLLDETFGPQLQTIGQATTSSSPPPIDSATPMTNKSAQFIFVTATLPDVVVQQIESQFSGTYMIKGPGLHRVAPTVKERLLDVSVPSALNRNEDACFDAKATALQQALRQNRCKRTLVFCNTVTTCRQVENLLQRLDRKNQIYTVRSYHNAMTPEARNENLDYFAKAGSGGDVIAARKAATVQPSSHRKQLPTTTSSMEDGTSYILVCTDRAARGVDFAAAAVDHVIMFDFPVDPAEYVRRVGRTARAGRDGSCTVLAYGWQLPIARSVMGQQQAMKQYTGVNTTAKLLPDQDTSEEYAGGVKGRRSSARMKKAKRSSTDEMIGSNIASGKLWTENKEK